MVSDGCSDLVGDSCRLPSASKWSKGPFLAVGEVDGSGPDDPRAIIAGLWSPWNCLIPSASVWKALECDLPLFTLHGLFSSFQLINQTLTLVALATRLRAFTGLSDFQMEWSLT